MKRIFTLLLLQFFLLLSKAQSPAACDIANLECSIDLSGTIYTNIVTTPLISYAKTPLPLNFRDVIYAGDDYDPLRCPGPSSDACLNDASALVYTVTYPKDHQYNICPLKPVVLMHAGGFAECSSYNQSVIKRMATTLASKGFVVFNVEYRRGRTPDRAIGSIYKTAQEHLAPYRAAQDIRGFFRSMIKRERNKSQFSDEWKIDTANIFIGGFSAGAFTALNVAWYTNSMINSLYSPAVTSTSSGNITTLLGSPDIDFYYGEPDLDFHDFYQPKIKGVCSMWGAIPMPYQPYNNENQQPLFFANSNLTPAILFHGYNDPVFPLLDRPPNYTRNVYLSPPPTSGGIDYNSVSNCVNTSAGIFKVNTSGSSADLINGSSYNIYKILTYYSKRCEIYVDCTMGHGLDDNCTSPPGCYGSDFGSGAINQDQTVDYMATRIAVFFQKVLHPPTTYGNTIFVECANNSIKCQVNTNCTNRSCSNQDIIFEP